MLRRCASNRPQHCRERTAPMNFGASNQGVVALRLRARFTEQCMTRPESRPCPQHDYIKWNERREALRPTSSWGSNMWPSSATECGSGRSSNDSTSSHVQRHCPRGPQEYLETHATELCRRHRTPRLPPCAISPSAALLLRHRRRAVSDVTRQRSNLFGGGRCRRRRCGLGID